jgi:hypothetical protein
MKPSNLLARLVLLGALIAPALSCLAQQVSVPLGQSMLSRDRIKINVSTAVSFSIGSESVSMVNNNITVMLRPYESGLLPGPRPPFFYVPATNADVDLGRLPQGTYSVEVVLLDRLAGAPRTVGTTQITILDNLVARSEAFPAYDFTDLWWNPSESGWGISIHVKRDALFGAWFVYDASGKPTWYTLQGGAWTTANTYRGQIYVTTSNPDAGVGPLSTLTVAPVGMGTLSFSGMDQAVFTYDVDGVIGAKNIVRQVF